MPSKAEYKRINQIYRQDPIKWMVDILGMDKALIWDKMEEIIYSVRDNKRTAVKAGHSVSKSYSTGRIALWFLYNFYPSTVITTAPSHDQVEQILWREMRDAHAKAKVPLGGHVTKTQIDLEEKWFAYGFSTKPDTASQEVTKMQGFHNKYVLIIFDEANGILPAIWAVKDALLTSEHAKFLAIGNPTTARGDFVDCFKSKEYNKITISVLDTPNYKEGREIIPGLSGRDYERITAEKHGKDSNWYKSRVLGEIPDEDVDALIPVSWIERAVKREPYNNYKFTKKFVVWDVADGGDDLHVIKFWENKTEIDEIVLRQKTIEEAEPYVWRLLRKHGGNAIVYDADGIGRVAGGYLDLTADDNTTIIPFKGSDKAHDDGTFKTRRDEGHWAMREDFMENIISISDNKEQFEEIATTKLDASDAKYIRIEKKDKHKEVLGHSPDFKDNIMMMSGAFDEVPVSEQKPDKYAKQTVYKINPDAL